MALKALAGRRLSLVSFGIAQVAMDIEPLVHIIRGDRVHHGWVHTYLGATAVGLATLIIARPVTRWMVGIWRDGLRHQGVEWLAEPECRGWGPIWVGTFAGTYSHVFLDSVMHADMAPLAPFAEGNVLLHTLSNFGIHLFCMVSGIVGLCAWVVAQKIRAGRSA